MSTSAIVFVLAGCIAVAAGKHVIQAQNRSQTPTDEVLATYLRGDTGALVRTFARSRDFEDKLRLADSRQLERWLGPFDGGKAVFLLALADIASRIAPQYTAQLVQAGRRYVAAAGTGAGASAPSAEFLQTWHRVAVGVLEGLGKSAEIEDHVKSLEARRRGQPSVPVDPRLVLAQGIAQERRCWEIRPSLDQPSQRIDAISKAAGATIHDDLDGPTKAGRAEAVKAHRLCLQEALSRFQAAAGIGEVGAEARVRGGWTLFQAGRFDDALSWLDQARTIDDRELAYWRDLFRGRVLDSLGRYEDAAAAYQAALSGYPLAQSASIGFMLDLVRMGRKTEADDLARKLRASAGTAPDPWTDYAGGDGRFVNRGLEQLRLMVSRS